MNEHQIFIRCAWRLIPLMGLLYFVNFIDRTNVSFAALTMNEDLGFSPAVFGFGAGVFFVGYALFQVPANLILERLGAKRWIFCILAVWGLLSASTALVQGPVSFYAVRFFLGVAEAGFFPGMMLYLTYWFPRAYLSRFTANFMIAIPLSFVVGGPLSSLILGMDGVAGLHGWQWLFLIEGVPAFLLSFAVLRLLPDSPRDATWLTVDEQKAITMRLATEEQPDRSDLWSALFDPRILTLGVASFIFQASTYGVVLWLPQIVRAMGFSNVATGLIVALPAVAGAGAMILCGCSSSIRDERVWHVALPWLLGALCFAVVSVAQSYWTALMALAIGTVALYAPFGPFFSLPSSFLRGTAAAGGIGVFNTFGSLGGFFGPTIIGVLAQENGDYAAAMAAAATGFALTVLVVLAVGRALTPRPAVIKLTVGSEQRPYIEPANGSCANTAH